MLTSAKLTQDPPTSWIMAEKGSPSLEDIISRQGLAKKILQEKCSQAIRLKIAAKLEDWKMVGRYLNIPSEELKAIELENSTEKQRRIAMLDTWHDREGEDASYWRLAGALYQQGCCHLVELLCKLVQSSVQELCELSYREGSGVKAVSEHDASAESSPSCTTSRQSGGGIIAAKSCESG